MNRNRRWMFRLWIVVGLWWGVCWAAEATPPWSKLISLETVDADPNKAYALTEEHGPWMIMACSFSGDGAEQQAKELVYDLRKRYKLPAYAFEGHFDPGEAQGSVRFDRFGNPQRWTYEKYKDNKDKNKARHPELVEIAVLVGNYQDADDPEAHKTLQKLKYTKPPCLEVKDGKKTNQSLTGLRMLQRQVYESMGNEKKKLGPMGHAFVTRNPLLPPEYFTPKNTIDPLVVAMNKNAEFSLLECPGKYTVKVATFKGQVIIKQDEIKAVQNGDKDMKSSLEEAAYKAHRLAKALRIKGYEAYEYHDRYASIVTVGSFASLGTTLPNGTINYNPDILKVMRVFSADSQPNQELRPDQKRILQEKGLDKNTQAMLGKSLVGMVFFVPTPIEVPKRSISMALRARE